MIKVLHTTLRMMWQRLQGEPKKLLHWYVLGTRATPPPDLFKKRLVKSIGRQFGLKAFIETGTYRGDMTAAASLVFDKVYSVELHRPFYDQAKVRFGGNTRVQILLGDSAEVLRNLLVNLQEPCLFWLDAHGGASAKNSDGTEAAAPVRPELEAILNHSLANQHVILVDDIHTFVRSTKWGVGVWTQIEELRAQWLTQHPDWVWKVKDNVLRIYKKR